MQRGQRKKCNNISILIAIFLYEIITQEYDSDNTKNSMFFHIFVFFN